MISLYLFISFSTLDSDSDGTYQKLDSVSLRRAQQTIYCVLSSEKTFPQQPTEEERSREQWHYLHFSGPGWVVSHGEGRRGGWWKDTRRAYLKGQAGSLNQKKSTLLWSSPSSKVQSSSPRCVDSLHVRRDERYSGIMPGQGGDREGRSVVMMAGSRRVHEEKTAPGPALTLIKPFCSHQGPLGTLLKIF